MNYENKNELEMTDTTTLIEKKFYKNGCEDIGTRWKKTCPKCNELQIYSSNKILNIAIKKNTCCQKCGSLSRIIDITGKRFGRLVVVSRGENDKYSKSRWMCKCDCGNEKIIGVGELKRGHSKSCGCFRQEVTTKRNLKCPYHWIYVMLKGQAKYVKKVCTITYEDILDFVKINKCYYCNTEIVWSEHGTNKNYHSYRLDRKDNNVGYTKDNCVVCCKLCNRVKLDIFTPDEMLKIGPFIKNIMNERTHD